MITDNLKEELLTRDTTMLNFKGLVEFMEKSDVEFIGCELVKVLGLAIPNRVYINMYIFCNTPNDVIFFVMLHEYCHTLRINKMGKAKLIENLSADDFDEYFDHIIDEEIVADRYGSRMFFRFNNRILASYYTQRLHIKNNKENYKPYVTHLYGKIQHSEEIYDELVNSYIITE